MRSLKFTKVAFLLDPLLTLWAFPQTFWLLIFTNSSIPLVGKSVSFIKDFFHFVEFIKVSKLDDIDLLVSFDVVSLFSTVHILEVINIMNSEVAVEIASLVELCLRSTFFAFQGVVYEQVEGVAMGSSLSTVIASL